MTEILIALGIARDLAEQVVPLLKALTAEGRDPTPEEIAQIKALQKIEEDEFNSEE